ncbi:hypothetical protein C8F04DRAFT_1248278 [Mycena alexandri]|uniref:Uncharacterized protein n=1 Tax=Mycena alexandri TaxID=1745969 RepID=A0AAD6TIN6_9AGAR|nr:hypothetical protein C8F04DRAFT_1248278 [Mycena alexandri]
METALSTQPDDDAQRLKTRHGPVGHPEARLPCQPPFLGSTFMDTAKRRATPNAVESMRRDTLNRRFSSWRPPTQLKKGEGEQEDWEREEDEDQKPAMQRSFGAVYEPQQ